jgi:hypothetical protein
MEGRIMTGGIGRRTFLTGAARGGAGFLILRHAASARGAPANSQINVALVGVGGRGTWFVDVIPRMARVRAVCDVNRSKIGEARKRWAELAKRMPESPQPSDRAAAPPYQALVRDEPKAYADFRRMLDEMGRDLDAVIVAVPDHTHAAISAAAIRAGKHVFCEKPLTRTVAESRALRGLARQFKVATSMGNQGTAAGPFRRALELIRNGTLGEVREVHVWNTGGGADKHETPKDGGPVPDGLDWDLWLGPAAARPYHREWMRRHNWREFGTSQLGNWASHSANLAFMALRVNELWAGGSGDRAGRIRIRAEHSGLNRLSFPRWEKVHWEIPARAGLPPLTITWHNGRAPGSWTFLGEKMGRKAEGTTEPKDFEFAGAVVLGSRGRIHTTGHNATFRLLPEGDFAGVSTDRPETVEGSRGHEQDWFAACRGGKPAWANFDYAAPLNEFLMLGNVATQVEGAFEYDPVQGVVVGHDAASRLLTGESRDGWTL